MSLLPPALLQKQLDLTARLFQLFHKSFVRDTSACTRAFETHTRIVQVDDACF